METVDNEMSGGVRVEVTLLDGRKLEFSVGVRLFTQELMSLVTSHCSLREAQYFALAFKDNSGHNHWLLDDRRLLDHDFARGVRTLPLHFLVRFFPESVTELRDAQTVELFYQQGRNAVSKGLIEVESPSAARLAALSLQAAAGDFISEATSKSSLKKCSISLSYTDPLEHTHLQLSEERVCGEHQQLIGLSRGDAILSYMRHIECIPGYGVHFYEVRDRSNLPWFLGISQKGISQYDFLDKRKPVRLFFWKQLENLYFRERKFSIEVHDPKRVILALNSFNLYEGAIQRSGFEDDLLLQAITEDTTQVSVSRRTFGPGNVSVYVWFAESQSLCKSIWSMAIAQHQFYLDRKTSRVKVPSLDSTDVVGELSRSCLSLSNHSSSPNLSRSGSHSSLQHHSHTDSASTESLHAARMEMVSALQQRYETLQEKLEEKTEELRLLCLREGELTGELPPEYPIKPGEPPPVVRKRVGTSFMLDEALINKIINKQEETVASLELEYEIQAKIASAALRLANESSMKKGLRKQRKHSYHQATQRLRDIEQRLKQAKARQAQVIANNASTMPKMKKKPRPVSDGEGVQDDSCVGLGSVKETSFVEGVSLSPSTCSPAQQQAPKSLTVVSGHPPLHSAPPSPQRSSSGAGTPSEGSFGQQSMNKSSRSNSPARPTSGYIPSVVYTRNQYRAQHYPTLSTRGQSAPCENLTHQRSFNGGLYNLPQQRTSIASHSLDDLDASNPSSPLLNTPKNSPLAQLPPHPHSVNYQYTPHHHHFKHHHHHHHHHVRRQRNSNENHDRFGSLDRRKATSGRFESRSMEHLDSLPPYLASSPSPTSSPNPSAHPNPHGDYGLPMTEPMEGYTYPTHHYPYAPDAVDGGNPQCHPNGPVPTQSPHQRGQGELEALEKCATRGLTRSVSGRDYPRVTETTYFVTPTNAKPYTSALESPASTADIHPHAANQENIPPLSVHSPATDLIPLRVSHPHRGYSKREGYSTSLRPTASVNAADHLRPFRMATSDVSATMRSTKSSSELPPLKPTNGRYQDPNSPYANTHPSQEAMQKSNTPTSRMNGLYDEPLLSLADAARLRKEQREREWMEGGGTNEKSYPPHESRLPTSSLHNESRLPSSSLHNESRLPPSSLHNVSTSSIGSSESGGSVFPSTTEGSDSLNSTLNSSSLNATLTVISTGSYQPSREVSKPFEMSDFYKYSTKFRRKSSSSGGNQESGSQDSSSSLNGSIAGIGSSPMSPSLPPRSSQLVMNVTNNTPNPSNSSNSIPTSLPNSSHIPPQQSSPSPQQKGVYQPLTPLTCKPLEDSATDPLQGEQLMHANSASHRLQRGSWEHTPIHQAVPVNVTTKRSATLV